MNSNNPNNNSKKRKSGETNHQQSDNQSQQQSGNKRPKNDNVPLRRWDPTINLQQSDTPVTQIPRQDPTRGRTLPPFSLVLTDRRTPSRNERMNQNPQSDNQQRNQNPQ